jgi:hypothetical protein
MPPSVPVPLALRAPAIPQSLSALLFENHYLYWIVLLILGAVLLVLARQRRDRRILGAGQVLLALTLLWALAARLLETPAERLYAVHLGLASAAGKHDVDQILSYCEAKFSMDSINIHPDTADAKKEIQSRLDQLGIKETTFRQYAITLNGDGTAVTRFTALTLSDAGPIVTTWQVSWDDLPESDWKLHNATLLKIGNQDVGPGSLMP